MDYRYPGGRKFNGNESALPTGGTKRISYGKRGMTLEEDLNETNAFYLARGEAAIHKKPTPIQIVQVDYKSRSTAVIREAYFRQASTTDYNGVCNGKYIDFEAKETQSTTSFPLKNFHEHQIQHMRTVVEQNGISFVILRFARTNDVYLLESSRLFLFWDRMNDGGRKSISKEEIISSAHPIGYGLHPRLDYLQVIRRLYSF